MLLDTSTIVELLAKPATDPLVRRILDAVGDAPLFASPIHIGEVADAARRSGIDPAAAARKAMEIVELIPLDASLAIGASSLKAEARARPTGRDFSLIDGVGLATARSRGLPMLTLDREFLGLPDATVLAP